MAAWIIKSRCWPLTLSSPFDVLITHYLPHHLLSHPYPRPPVVYAVAIVRLDKQTTFLLFEVQVVRSPTWYLFVFCLVFVCCLMKNSWFFDAWFHTSKIIKISSNNSGPFVGLFICLRFHRLVFRNACFIGWLDPANEQN